MTGGRAILGGCAMVLGHSHLKLVNSRVSGCSTLDSGGGLSVDKNASVHLINSTISNNTAGVQDSEQTRKVHGGGVALWDAARMVLEGSEISGNYAQYAAGVCT